GLASALCEARPRGDRDVSVASILRGVSAGEAAGQTAGRGHPGPPSGERQVDRAQKTELVATLNSVFQETGVVVVAHYSGLSVAEMTSLRVRMKEAGASLKVAKNRLVKL